MARVLAENPARIFGLYPRKGAIRVGADADLTIIDPEPETTITVSDHKGIAGWTLYEGWKARGRPWMTLLRGEVLLDQGRLVRPAGYGQFLRRGAPMAPLGGAAR
jgi:dihydroorotase-like cyclic amidohydrolase